MGRIQTRYEITHNQEGLIDTETTLLAAKKHALEWGKSNTGYPNAIFDIRVYDSMARVGQTTQWRYDSKLQLWYGTGLRIN